MRSPIGLSLLAALCALACTSGARAQTGCVTDSNNVVLTSTATLQITLDGTTPCTGYDQYNVTGSLTLQLPTLDVILGSGFTPAAGESFQILSWGSLSGTFGTITLPSLAGGLVWDSSTLYTNGTIVVRSVSNVPLPPWSLVALALALFAAAMRLRSGPISRRA